MSPRAAWRLESLGYGPVYDYAAGKVDWLAAGLRTIRAGASERRALDSADRHPPTCQPDELVSDVTARHPGSSVLVINEQRIVLGRYRTERNFAGASRRIADGMEPGPTTVRAHELLAPLLDRMGRRNVKEVIVTTPEAELLGIVRTPSEAP